MQNLLTSVELCGSYGSYGSYGLYKITMDLEVCYEFKSGFADVCRRKELYSSHVHVLNQPAHPTHQCIVDMAIYLFPIFTSLT